MMFKIFPGVLLLLVLVGGAFAADPKATGRHDGNRPMQITSDRLEADDAKGRARFIGNVVARQGDVVIYGQEMILYGGPENRRIQRIEIYRDVRIVQGSRVATAQKGIFYNDEGRVVLTGSPKVHQGEDFVEGEEITVFLNEDRSIVQGREGSRVNAVFHPKKEQP